MCRRVGRAGREPPVAQQTLLIAVMPKYTYGLQQGLTPQGSRSMMKAAVKRALRKSEQGRSWELLGVGVFPAHQLDPHVRAAFTHLRALVQGLTDGTTPL